MGLQGSAPISPSGCQPSSLAARPSARRVAGALVLSFGKGAGVAGGGAHRGDMAATAPSWSCTRLHNPRSAWPYLSYSCCRPSEALFRDGHWLL